MRTGIIPRSGGFGGAGPEGSGARHGGRHAAGGAAGGWCGVNPPGTPLVPRRFGGGRSGAAACGAAAEMHRAGRSGGAGPPFGGVGDIGRAAAGRHRRAGPGDGDGRVAAIDDYTGSTPRLLALCFGAEICPPISASRRVDRAAMRRPCRRPVRRRCWRRPGLGCRRSTRRGPTRRTRLAWWTRRRTRPGRLCRASCASTRRQIALANTAFTPTPGRIAWARRVEAAFAEKSGSGVLTLDGAMIDQPHLKLARRILAAA